VPDLGDVAWPPEPIRTERLVVRASAERDRPGLAALYSSVEVFRYLGGPRRRDLPGDRPGFFVVERDGELLGTLSLGRRDTARPGSGGVELSYLLLPTAWGRGYATEAARAALAWVAEALPGEPLVLCTQVANAASVRLAERLGFAEQERFEEFGAEQWFGVRRGRTAG
jgi:RimJ/RimL family protein N-acetyltransferase